MPTLRRSSVLTGLTASQAMRRQVVKCQAQTAISEGIRSLVKYKSNALLVTDDRDRPLGVVSNTDLMGAYYASLPVATALGDIVAAVPLFCYPDDGLETCIDTMHQNRIHQLYVVGATIDEMIGVLDYGDILGLLYRYCRRCTQSRHASRLGQQHPKKERLRVKDVMTPEVEAFPSEAPLTAIIEVLSARGFGAVLIHNEAGWPEGVISKSDLIMGYQHGVETATPAHAIMGRPVVSYDAEGLLAYAIQQMLVRDVQRLFIHRPTPKTIVGVLSLSNAARFRSGTCRACRSSRVMEI